MQKITKRIKNLQHQAALYYFVVIMALGLGLSSCQKDEDTTPRPQGEMITQEFSLETITGYNMEKSFDPEQWVYQYSNQQYELKLQSTDGKYVYSKMVSVTEMLQGTVSFQMWSGQYNISYTPQHQQKFDNVLDVAIQMTNVQINGSPITLQGQLQDALIILDRNDLLKITDDTGREIFFFDNRGFWYAYVNQSFSVTMVDAEFWRNIPISCTVEWGKVYWFSTATQGNIILNIPNLEVIRQQF
jgi:hypothetical protein